MSKSQDAFRPAGQTISVHRAGRYLCAIDLSEELSQSEVFGATAEVSFWVRVPLDGWQEDDTDFGATSPEVVNQEARFFIDPPVDADARKRGVRVDLTLVDGRVLVSDHYLDVRGSVS